MLIKVDHLLNSAKTAIEAFQVESCVRGHHLYKDVWSPSFGVVLQCTRELENTKDRYVVAVVWRSTVCCEVTGTRCYSEDPPRGGLGIPCKAKY